MTWSCGVREFDLQRASGSATATRLAEEYMQSLAEELNYKVLERAVLFEWRELTKRVGKVADYASTYHCAARVVLPLRVCVGYFGEKRTKNSDTEGVADLCRLLQLSAALADLKMSSKTLNYRQIPKATAPEFHVFRLSETLQTPSRADNGS